MLRRGFPTPLLHWDTLQIPAMAWHLFGDRLLLFPHRGRNRFHLQSPIALTMLGSIIISKTEIDCHWPSHSLVARSYPTLRFPDFLRSCGVASIARFKRLSIFWSGINDFLSLHTYLYMYSIRIVGASTSFRK